MDDSNDDLTEALSHLMHLLPENPASIQESADVLIAVERLRKTQDHVLSVTGTLGRCTACNRPFQ